jgi:hypothetical protein
MPPLGQVIEKLTNGGQMLPDGGLRDGAAELLDIRRDRNRFDVVELQPAFVAAVKEAIDRACKAARVGGVTISSVRTIGALATLQAPLPSGLFFL